jgi:tetratricopeptide (TPR) repeat protein
VRLSPLAALLVAASATSHAHAGSCEELVRSARAHEASGDRDIALHQYDDAVSLDPTCSAAWLGLGALRVRTGNVAEAERVYSTALRHLPNLTGAMEGRARIRWQLGRVQEAEDDMERFVETALTGATDTRTALAGLVELAAWYASAHRDPAQLAVWRRIAALALGTDEALEARARTNITALVIVVGSADPVTHPPRVDLLRSVAARLRR